MSSDYRLMLTRADKRKIGKYIRQQYSGSSVEVRRVKFCGDGTISVFVVWPSVADVLCGEPAYFGEWRFEGWEEDYYHLIS